MEGDIVVSNFELQSHYYVHFQTDTLEKNMTPPTYSSSYKWLNGTITRMALALNNPKKFICH